MEDLKVTLIQSDLFWEDIDRNLAHFSQQLATLKDPGDLILLPEMFNTGFTMRSEKLAEAMMGKTMTWMQQQSKAKNCVLTGSLIIQENGMYFNRLLWIRPDGTFDTYDKRHLFRMAEEDTFYTAGKKKLLTEIKGWKICPLVCYDLRFPVWSRNKFTINPASAKEYKAEYDVLIYIANWPERRSHPWKALLTARAIENQAYVIGLNRVGNDGNSIYYSGDSSVTDFKGETISSNQSGREYTETIRLDYSKLDGFRKSFPVGLDADPFQLN